jgi:hypothetical protein
LLAREWEVKMQHVFWKVNSAADYLTNFDLTTISFNRDHGIIIETPPPKVCV